MDDSVCEGFNNCQSKILASDDEGSIWSINLQDYSYNSYGGFVINSEIERICKYSYEGELISYVDVEVTRDLSYRTFAVGSDVYLMLQAYNEDANRFEMTMYQVDFEGGTLIEKSDTELARTLSDSNTTVVGSFVLGDRNVIQIFSVNTGLTLVYVNDDLSYEKRYIGDELYE